MRLPCGRANIGSRFGYIKIHLGVCVMALVTFCMSVHNGMPYLPAAVGSILEQTYDDFKIIIVNDGSTDKSADYLHGLKDSRLLVIDQENHGLGAALNRCLVLAKTEYVARMDADDISSPERLEKQMEAVLSNRLVMCGTRLKYFTDGSIRTVSPPMPTAHNDIVRLLKAGGHGISHPTIVCKTDVMRSVGGYRINGPGQDWDLFLRMIEAGPTHNVPEPLYMMRFHGGSTTSNHMAKIAAGIAYSRETANRRAANMEEPTFDQFIESWHARPLTQRVQTRLFCQSQAAYKRAMHAFLNGKTITYYSQMILAAFLDPGRVALRVLKRAGG